MTWVVVGAAAFGCGMLAAATAGVLFKMPEPGFIAACRQIGTSLQTMIDSIQFSSEDTSALIKALLTGERSGLSAEIESAFRDSGASHILALSGLHLGIIYGALSKLLSILGNNRPMRISRSILIVSICGIYTLATGAGDSLVRSLIFITLRELAKATSRYHGLGQILLASLIIQLIISPLSIKSVGFQLSYAAMAGIAFISPWLQGFWDRAAGKTAATETIRALIVRPAKWTWNTVSLAIACQITTAPLAYMYFGTFPVHFMLTNLLTLPLTGLLIPSALLTLCLSAIGCCPLFMVQVTEWLASTLVWMLEVISTM
jgi:competence protein ComEC